MRKLLAILLALSLSVSLAACGGGDDTVDTTTTAATTTAAAEETTSSGADTTTAAADTTKAPVNTTKAAVKTTTKTPVKTTTKAPQGGMTLQAYIDSIQGELDQMADALKESGLNVKVLARGNSLVYSYQYINDMPDAVIDSLSQTLDAMSSTYEGVLSAVRMAVPSTESVILEYRDKNGKIIASKEFK